MAVADDRVFADGSLAAPPKPMLEGAPNLSAFRRQGRGRSAASGPTKKQQSDAPFDVDAVRAREITRAVMSHKHKERRKLQANPPAAVTHKAEAGAPWRRAADREIEEDNARARVELQEKRMTHLATQGSRGLMKNYGIHYEMTSLRNLIVEAYKLRDAGHADDDGASRASGGAGTSRPRTSETGTSAGSKASGPAVDVTPLQLLDALQRYDLPKVITLLGLDVPDKSDKAMNERTIPFASTITHGKLPPTVTGELPAEFRRKGSRASGRSRATGSRGASGSAS